MNKSTTRLTLTALFVALVLLFGLTPIGMIPLGFINITILGIPVVVGTLVLGLKAGLLLGLCFGIVSGLSAFGYSPFASPSALAGTLAAANWVLAWVMCLVPRLLVPVSAHLIYRAAARGNTQSKRALSCAAVAGSLTNTVLYLGLMLLFYRLLGLDDSRVLALIGGTALIAGSAEAVVNALITPAVVIALRKAGNK